MWGAPPRGWGRRLAVAGRRKRREVRESRVGWTGGRSCRRRRGGERCGGRGERLRLGRGDRVPTGGARAGDTRHRTGHGQQRLAGAAVKLDDIGTHAGESGIVTLMAILDLLSSFHKHGLCLSNGQNRRAGPVVPASKRCPDSSRRSALARARVASAWLCWRPCGVNLPPSMRPRR